MSSMSNAGQGTRGLSGSDWTRMKRLIGARNNNSQPTTTTSNALTAVGPSTTAGNGVLAYVAGSSNPLTVTFTTAPTTINVVSAANVVALQPVIFTTSFAGLVAGTTYYVGSTYASGLAIPLSSTANGTTPLSSGNGNAIISSSTTSTGANVSVYNISVTVGGDNTTLTFLPTAPTYPTLTDLAVIFHTSTNANITVGKVYFVKLYAIGSMQLAATYLGATITSFTNGGTASGSVFPAVPGSFTHSAQTSGAVTLAVTSITTGSGGTFNIASSTNPLLVIGTPVTFATAVGGVVPGQTYYIYASATGGATTSFKITVTSGGGGTSFAPDGAITTGTMTYGSVLSVTNTNLTVGMPIVFTTSVQSIISGTTYYVQSLVSTTGISISAAPDLLTTFVAGASVTGSAFRSVVGCNAFSVASGTGGALTLSNAYPVLDANRSIIFTSAPTGLTAGNPYFLLTATGTPTAITYSQTYNGSAYTVGSGTGIGYCVATTSFTAVALTTATTMTLTGTAGAIGNPIVFGSTLGGLTLPVYYISSLSSQIISVSPTSPTTSFVTFNVGSTASMSYSPVYSQKPLALDNSKSLSLFATFSTNPAVAAISGTGSYQGQSDVLLTFGIQNPSGNNITSINVDLQSATSLVYLQISGGSTVTTTTTVASGDILGFIILGKSIVFYKNNIPFYTLKNSVSADTYTFFSSLNNLGVLTVSQNMNISYSQITYDGIINTNADISPQMAAQLPYNPSMLIKAVVGTGKIRRPASNWTDYIASQKGDFVTNSQNTGADGSAQPGVTQTLTKLCDPYGNVYTPSKNILPSVNAFNRLKILS